MILTSLYSLFAFADSHMLTTLKTFPFKGGGFFDVGWVVYVGFLGLVCVFCLVVVGGCLAQLLLAFCVLGCGLCLGVFGGSVLVVVVVTSCCFLGAVSLQKQIGNFWLLVFGFWFF
jgi:hypothetical protein